MGDKLRTPVGGDMGRYSMLGEDMGDKGVLLTPAK